MWISQKEKIDDARLYTAYLFIPSTKFGNLEAELLTQSLPMISRELIERSLFGIQSSICNRNKRFSPRLLTVDLFFFLSSASGFAPKAAAVIRDRAATSMELTRGNSHSLLLVFHVPRRLTQSWTDSLVRARSQFLDTQPEETRSVRVRSKIQSRRSRAISLAE